LLFGDRGWRVEEHDRTTGAALTPDEGDSWMPEAVQNPLGARPCLRARLRAPGRMDRRMVQKRFPRLTSVPDL
jgi:hypothetical protein